MLLPTLFLVFLTQAVVAAYPPKFVDAKSEIYREVDGITLKAWVVGEGDGKKLKPAVVLFFGGSWRSGSPSDLQRHAIYLAKRGFICVLPDYRVFNRNGTLVSACVEDANAALAWTSENAERLGINPRYIAAGGASSGGHLAACTALVPGFGNTVKPAALVLFNPALVLAPFEGDSFGFVGRISERLLGAKPEEISPIHHIRKDAPPTWMTHGSLDPLVPISTAKAFQKEMKQEGNRAELLEAEGERHAFHYRDPFFSESMTGAFTFLKSLGWVE